MTAEQEKYMLQFEMEMGSYNAVIKQQIDEIDFFSQNAANMVGQIISQAQANGQELINQYMEYLSTSYAQQYAAAFEGQKTILMPLGTGKFEAEKNLVRNELERINKAFFENSKLKVFKITEKLQLLKKDGLALSAAGQTEVNAIIKNSAMRGESVANLSLKLKSYFSDSQVRMFVGDGFEYEKDMDYLQLFNPKTGKFNNYNFENIIETWANTGLQRIAIQGNVDSWLAQGEDVVIVNYTDERCCPFCAPWQGVKLSLSGKSEQYQTLDTAKASGLLHPRCRHDIALYSSDAEIYYRGDQPIFKGVKMYPSQEKVFKGLGLL